MRGTRAAIVFLLAFALAGAAWWAFGAGDGDGADRAVDRNESDFGPDEDRLLDAEADEPEGMRLAGRAVRTVAGSDDLRAASGPSSDASDLGVVHLPTGTFRAGVLGTDGRPAAGVHLVVLNPRGTTTLTTDASGRVEGRLAYGVYDLLFGSTGGGGLVVPGFVFDGAATSHSFTLSPASRVTVEVRREGIGVASAEVTVRFLKAVALSLNRVPQQTGGDGTVVLEGIAHGSYLLSVRHDGEGWSAERSLSVTGDATVRFDLPPGVLLSGEVSDGATRAPVEGADVVVESRTEGSTFRASGTSGPDGRYRVLVPQARVRNVTVHAVGFTTWPAPKEASKIVGLLGPLSRNSPVVLDAALSRGASIEGTVRDEAGAPVADVTVGFKLRLRRPPVDATSGPDGRYVAEHVDVGTHDVVVSTPGYFLEQAARVEVKDSEAPTTFDVRVRRSRALEGVVVHASDTPAAGARVHLLGQGGVMRSSAGRAFETFSGTDGTFRLLDVPSNQGVVLRASLGSLEAEPVFVPAAPAPLPRIRPRLGPTGTLRGTVTDRTTGSAVAGAAVQLLPRDAPSGRARAEAVTGPDGAFAVPGLIPGSWETWATRGEDFLPTEHRVVSVPSEGGDVDASLELDPGLVFSGVVRDENGRGLAGAVVVVAGKKDNGEDVRRRSQTDARGEFRITGFVRGTYTLAARLTGHQNASIGDLLGGEDRLSLTLVPKPTGK